MGKVRQAGKFEQMTFDLKPLKLNYDHEKRQEFNNHKASGTYVECPCCAKQYNIMYKRQIHSSMIAGLESLLIRRGVTSSIGDFAKLRHWDLIEKDEGPHKWKITGRGIEFLQNLVSVPRYIFIQNNVKVGESAEMIRRSEI